MTFKCNGFARLLRVFGQSACYFRLENETILVERYAWRKANSDWQAVNITVVRPKQARCLGKTSGLFGAEPTVIVQQPNRAWLTIKPWLLDDQTGIAGEVLPEKERFSRIRTQG
ncbi:MAG: hypothetical protein A2Y07_03300 [Planctomycetes bacterium GWF2_50_10]|nr:MAG: hypothetical protein A2Y07_03300 [Planctomycetes bacterium GWF2_50_10]